MPQPEVAERNERMSGEVVLDQEWFAVCDIAEIPEDMGFRLETGADSAVAAFRVDTTFHVVDDRCSHGAASLADGFIEGAEIECPYHGGKFDLRTGEPTAFPCTKAIRVYETKVEDGRLYARPATMNEGSE